jgi:hypothetical protein
MICFFLFYRWRSGYRLRKGPIYMTDVFFDDFADNEYYNMGPNNIQRVIQFLIRVVVAVIVW